MAELPVESTGPMAASALGEPLPGASFLRGFSALPVIRQVGLMLALAASVAVGFSVVLWMRDPDYRPLTGVVSAYQTNEVAEALQANNIPYRLDESSGMLLVPAESLYEARMRIAGGQITGGGQVGFELLDKDQGFGVSQFMETAMYRRSLEGELARSIATISAIRQARVHLAIPKSTSFLRDQREPTASVTVTLSPGQGLADGQARAIMNLVAGAVAELKPEHVTIVDQSGRMLSQRDEEEDAFAHTDRQFKYVRQLEGKLQEKIRNILLPTVGANRFMAEVAADVDFTWVEETEELFNPDLPALRSEQTVDEQRLDEGAEGGIPGALSNQPPAVAVAPETAANVETLAENIPVPRRTHNSATRNFELDRTISHTRHQVGQVRRLTVSVVVDDLPVGTDTEGESQYEPWDQADLTRLSALVKNAIGYDPARGDMVSVVNSPFLEERVEEAPPTPFWAETWFLDMIKQVLGAVLLLVLVLGLLRPLFKSLSKAGDSGAVEDQAMVRLSGMGLPASAAYHDELETGGQVLERSSGALAGKAAPYDAKLDTVRGLVAENPARVAQVVKHWVAKDE